jgi:hypothetical protein
MPAAKQYPVLHDFHTVVDSKTGREELFTPAEPFDTSQLSVDDAAGLVAHLQAGHDFKGPLIGAELSPAGKPVDSEVK